MSNVGARRDLPLGDFGFFEGEQVVNGTLTFQGQRGAPRVLTEGETVFLLVQAEVRAVGFSRNTDGNLVRRHTLRVVEATEAPESIAEHVVTIIRADADERKARAALPGITDPDAAAAAIGMGDTSDDEDTSSSDAESDDATDEEG